MACSTRIQEHGLIVAYDFGTSYSGVAAKALSPEPLVLTDFPHQGAYSPYPKMPTLSLYQLPPGDPEGSWDSVQDSSHSHPSPDPAAYQLVAVGYAADQLYHSMNPATRRRHALLHRFKLQLAPRGADTEELAPLPPGLTAERVITDFLRELHKLGSKWLSQRSAYRSLYRPDSTSYVLTVPASWSDSSKAVMRHCAAAAGIIPSPQSHQLELLHEPEAAAVAMVRELKPYLSLKHGDTVLVIDLGGGTADITLHELVPNPDADAGGAPDHLSEVACRRAELAGSTFVDDRFEAWLEGRLGLGPDGFEGWKVARPRDRLKLFKAWEEQERVFGEDRELRDCKVQLPDTLWKLLPAHTRRNLSSAGASRAAAACTDDPSGWCDEDYAVVGDDDEEESGDDDEPYVYIKADTMVEELFEPVVDTIVWALRPVLAWDGGQADWVLASGGFSASPYVMRRLREEVANVLPDKDIVTVPNPGAAVLQGAALFGDNPQLVAARISTLAYGVKVTRNYHTGMLGTPFTSNITGRLMVDKCFHQFVKRNQLVVLDKTVEHTFRTTRQYQESVSCHAR